jgi:hypothetical protein
VAARNPPYIWFFGQRYQAIVLLAGEVTFGIVATSLKPTDRDEDTGVQCPVIVAGTQIQVVCHSCGRMRPPSALVHLQARYNHAMNPHPKNDWQARLGMVNPNRGV